MTWIVTFSRTMKVEADSFDQARKKAWKDYYDAMRKGQFSWERLLSVDAKEETWQDDEAYK